MRSTGVRRKLDDLGRVVIPAGIRRTLDLRDGDAIEFTVSGDEIILTRASDRCVVCGHQGDSLREVRGRRLCEQCVAEVAALPPREESDDASDVGTGSAGEHGQGGSVVTLPSSGSRSTDRDDGGDPGGRGSTTAW